MASLIPFLFLIIFPFLALPTPLVAQAPSPAPTSSAAATPLVHQICRTTRFPDVCAENLTVPGDMFGRSDEIIKSALTYTLDNTNTAIEMLTKIKAAAGNNQNLTVICSVCLEDLGRTLFRLRSSLDSFPGHFMDTRAWTSSTRFCLQSFKNVNTTVEINSLVSFLEKVNMMNSNALSMLWNMANKGTDTDNWDVPKTEREGFFGEGMDDPDFETEFPTDLKINATVSKDGGKGDVYKTVQEAVDVAPFNLTDQKFVIKINEGVYDEIVRIPFFKNNIVFIGDGIGKTIITGKLNAGDGISTTNSSTIGVSGDGFMAKGITFKNEAGIPTKQAVAFKSSSDRSYIENCEFIGHQDTLYSYSGRQVYESCRIEGNVDFIFGNGAAVFKDCKIFVNPRLENPEKGEQNFITAQGRSDPVQATGFVFNNCTITGTPEYMKLFESNRTKHKSFLGRPWRDFARTIFINSFFDSIIDPAGWAEWEGNNSLSTLFYGEFNNTGPGSDSKGRVPWSSQILEDDVQVYTSQNFIQGDKWLPRKKS
ncbi:Plant invertase/pectin methylesterase inhibitor superfamily [Euphorbia peplus]|nr:Plant invertase/pectin methylesterase inhibitor superfamily [Euphorbia peplus]